ncbi:MAG: bifunctional 5,10-methylene-tetrahydrofolate dehydrogenase/5,10-methylene-tetrahydrofolate cyclohydrolase, partial [Oscillospiraceae bacterium]|nr:bifunctional 5,10-methylene-tetrahydrofolate dehydrogenase/5,10-methylene-tetrahydrofolate cyclohydrolase [Oscillospiraceae bacterium]
MAQILDGKALSAKIKEDLALRAGQSGITPGLAVILVGEDPASRIYVNSKRKDCEECGFYSEEYTLPAESGQQDLLDLIDVLNGREDIDGILCQLPLPPQFDTQQVLTAIDPMKDVDCFHPVNVGRLMTGNAYLRPCTPAGIMELLKEGGISVSGKHCVILGRSNIVGKPTAMLMLQEDATVTICHSKTPDLAQYCLQADILVSAVGRRGLVTSDMIREGAVVVDVAMNRDENGKLCGDCCRDVY